MPTQSLAPADLYRALVVAFGGSPPPSCGIGELEAALITAVQNFAISGGGVVGPAGPTGPPGPIGPVGPTGPAGTNGLNGSNGTTGPQGPIGNTGPQGPTGPTGSTGATGPQGNPGTTGATGPQGPTGPAGVVAVATTTFTANAYTLALTDANTAQQASNGATACQINIPTNATVAFPIGTVITITQTGTGKVYLGGTGIIVRSTIAGGWVTGASGCRVQYSTISLLKVATDTWTLSGDVG